MSHQAIVAVTVGYCCQLAKYSIVAVVTTATSTLPQTHYIRRNHPWGGPLQPCSRHSQLRVVTAVCTPCWASHTNQCQHQIAELAPCDQQTSEDCSTCTIPCAHKDQTFMCPPPAFSQSLQT